jgi:hypothetical protein
MISIQPRTALGLLLVAFILLATAFSTIIPLGEAADEVSHHSYVRYLAEYGGLPPVVEGTTVFGETFQPPLYYALAAPLTVWLPTGSVENLGFDIPVENNPDWELGNPDRPRVLLQPASARWVWQGEALGWHLVRFLSVLIGVGTVYFTYQLGRLVWKGEAWTAWTAALFVAALPSFAGVSAVVTNDTLATLLSAILLWQLAKVVTTPAGEKWQEWAWVGGIGALGVWTKASGWLFVGTVVLGFALWLWVNKKPSFRLKATQNLSFEGQGPVFNALRFLFIAGGVWLGGIIPLWIVNWQRSGDIMGRNLQTLVTDARTQFTFADLLDVLYSLCRTWWAGFGGAVHISFGAPVNFGLLLLIFGIAGFGLLRRHLNRSQSDPATQQLIPLLTVHTLLVVLSWLAWTALVLGTGQGRLLFPALPAVAVLLAGGWGGLPISRRYSLGAFAGVMGLLLVGSITSLLLPAYRVPHVPEPLPANATVARWNVGDLPLALTAFYAPYTVDSRLHPGEITTLYVGWESTGQLPDVRVRLRWIDRDGNNVGAPKEGSPIANHPLTDEWQAGQYAATHKMILPEGIEGGYYRLMMSVIDAQTKTPIPLRSADGGMGDEIMVGQTTVVVP